MARDVPKRQFPAIIYISRLMVFRMLKKQPISSFAFFGSHMFKIQGGKHLRNSIYIRHKKRTGSARVRGLGRRGWVVEYQYT